MVTSCSVQLAMACAIASVLCSRVGTTEVVNKGSLSWLFIAGVSVT